MMPGVVAGATGLSLTQRVKALQIAKSLKGGMFAPDSVRSSLWEDVARTDPVLNASETVAGLDDLSNNGLYMRQVTAASEPTYNGLGLTFDGVNDWLSSTAAHNMAGSTYVYVVYVGKKATGVAAGARIFSSTGSYTSTAGTVGLLVNNGGTNIDMYARTSVGTVYRFAVPNDVTFSAVAAFNLNLATTAQLQAWIDNSSVSTAGGTPCPAGALTSGNPFYIGNASGPFKGELRRFLCFGSTVALTTDDVNLLRAWAEEGRLL